VDSDDEDLILLDDFDQDDFDIGSSSSESGLCYPRDFRGANDPNGEERTTADRRPVFSGPTDPRGDSECHCGDVNKTEETIFEVAAAHGGNSPDISPLSEPLAGSPPAHYVSVDVVDKVLCRVTVLEQRLAEAEAAIVDFNAKPKKSPRQGRDRAYWASLQPGRSRGPWCSSGSVVGIHSDGVGSPTPDALFIAVCASQPDTLGSCPEGAFEFVAIVAVGEAPVIVEGTNSC